MVQDSRGLADDALKRVPKIEDSIAKAEMKTEEARAALSGAENDANDALSIAEMAEKTAQDASDVRYRYYTYKQRICGTRFLYLFLLRFYAVFNRFQSCHGECSLIHDPWVNTPALS